VIVLLQKPIHLDGRSKILTITIKFVTQVYDSSETTLYHRVQWPSINKLTQVWGGIIVVEGAEGSFKSAEHQQSGSWGVKKAPKVSACL